MEERLETLRKTVDSILHALPDPVQRGDGFLHLYGVAEFAAVLAAKRGLPTGLAQAAAMLHDIYAYRTGIRPLHAHNGAEDARVLLRDNGGFSPQEQAAVCTAIFYHSDKQAVHAPLDEAIKDADVLQHYFYNPALPIQANEYDRLAALHAELGLPFQAPRPEATVKPQPTVPAERRVRLAQIAEELAAQQLAGNESKSGPQVYPIIRYFPGATPDAGFDWCAAFVYHCCMLAGFILPIRYPDPRVPCRFTGVPAWRAWAELAGFLHREADFQPQRGDIVLYDGAVSADPLDHIGMVLGCDGGSIRTAEGNVDNRSAILNRSRAQCVHGFIRIDEAYQYPAQDIVAPY